MTSWRPVVALSTTTPALPGHHRSLRLFLFCLLLFKILCITFLWLSHPCRPNVFNEVFSLSLSFSLDLLNLVAGWLRWPTAGSREGRTLLPGGDYLVGDRLRRGQPPGCLHQDIQVRPVDHTDSHLTLTWFQMSWTAIQLLCNWAVLSCCT